MGKAFPSRRGNRRAASLRWSDPVDGPPGWADWRRKVSDCFAAQCCASGKSAPPGKLLAIWEENATVVRIFSMMTSAFSRLPKLTFASCLRPAMMSGVVLTAALNAGGAFALDFNFTFSGGGSPTNPATVTGLISGLVDNTNNQKSGLTVTITSATNGPAGGVPSFTNYVAFDGLDVSNGIITDINILLDASQINLIF